MIKQGSIYLVNFNPSKGTEAGKIWPALVVQTDFLNELSHVSTMVMPLTTQLSRDDNVLRFRLTKRDSLEKDSDVMLDQIRAIDNRRSYSERLASLTADEWAELHTAYLRLIS